MRTPPRRRRRAAAPRRPLAAGDLASSATTTSASTAPATREGLHGAQVQEFPRIAAVADVYDAVTSERVYKAAAPPHVGVRVIREGAGTQFCPTSSATSAPSSCRIRSATRSSCPTAAWAWSRVSTDAPRPPAGAAEGGSVSEVAVDMAAVAAESRATGRLVGRWSAWRGRFPWPLHRVLRLPPPTWQSKHSISWRWRARSSGGWCAEAIDHARRQAHPPLQAGRSPIERARLAPLGRRHHPRVHRQPHELEPLPVRRRRTQPERVEQRAHVRLHRVDAEVQLGRDLLVGRRSLGPRAQRDQDAALGGRQRRRDGVRRPPRSACRRRWPGRGSARGWRRCARRRGGAAGGGPARAPR